MIAQAVNMMNFMKGPKQFIIPIYQRTYSNLCFNSPEFEGIKSEAGLNRFKRLVPKVISINIRNVVSEVF